MRTTLVPGYRLLQEGEMSDLQRGEWLWFADYPGKVLLCCPRCGDRHVTDERHVTEFGSFNPALLCSCGFVFDGAVVLLGWPSRRLVK